MVAVPGVVLSHVVVARPCASVVPCVCQRLPLSVRQYVSTPVHTFTTHRAACGIRQPQGDHLSGSRINTLFFTPDNTTDGTGEGDMRTDLFSVHGGINHGLSCLRAGQRHSGFTLCTGCALQM